MSITQKRHSGGFTKQMTSSAVMSSPRRFLFPVVSLVCRRGGFREEAATPAEIHARPAWPKTIKSERIILIRIICPFPFATLPPDVFFLIWNRTK